jgi:hypothetical protein
MDIRKKTRPGRCFTIGFKVELESRLFIMSGMHTSHRLFDESNANIASIFCFLIS